MRPHAIRFGNVEYILLNASEQNREIKKIEKRDELIENKMFDVRR